jgi:hypothetical protein
MGSTEDRLVGGAQLRSIRDIRQFGRCFFAMPPERVALGLVAIRNKVFTDTLTDLHPDPKQTPVVR